GGPANQSQAGAIVVEHLDNFFALSTAHVKIDQWIPVVKFDDGFGKKTTRQRGQCADGDTPTLARFAQARGLDALVQYFQRSLYIGQEVFAALGQGQFTSPTNKKRPA